MAEEGQVISCHSVESWREQIAKSNEPDKLVVVEFTALWCGPCHLIARFLAELAEKFPNVLFLKVDVDELKTVAQEWAVKAMPTFMFVKGGEIVDRVEGRQEDQLRMTLAKHMATASP
ncbi:hypothetical protein ACJRO7_035877 [Eucalyptus globulus]|uniref:Thioredoxin domain-containing protein n=1 Tax=Eucalyptus globulus TaxID=34317 RepID=A0ABD3J9Z9_EUCGL